MAFSQFLQKLVALNEIGLTYTPTPTTPFLYIRYTVRHHTHIMGSKPRMSTPAASTTTRKSPNSSRRLQKPVERHRMSGGASVSDKLEALKSLIPSQSPEIKPEQLFQETADYIALLKTQVFVLQKLIDFYASQHQQIT